MKRIIVTGSSGFIGRHTLPFLAKCGYEVYPLRINLTQPEAHRAQIKKIKPEGLLHLAWETTPGVYWHSPSNLDWLKCSLDLLESFALCGGKRAVIAGSCAEISPTTLYGASKESLRLTGAAFLRTQQVSFAWGRIFSPYGPHEKAKRLIPTLIQTLLDEEPFTCNSSRHLRDFFFVEDVAEAFVALLQSHVEGIVDIGSGKEIRVGDLVNLVAEKLNSREQITLTDANATEDNPTDLIANPQRLLQEVGFKPKHTLQEGIDKTIAWWKDEIYH